MRGKIVRALLVVALALGLASCGSSKPLSRADLVKQANVICKQRSTGIDKLRPRYARSLVGLVAAATPVIDESIADLGKLKPPSELKGKYAQFIAGERARVARLKTAVAAFKAHRRPPSESSAADEHRLTALKEQLGLGTCR
jgi:hypothetical protein